MKFRKMVKKNQIKFRYILAKLILNLDETKNKLRKQIGDIQIKPRQNKIQTKFR